MPEIEPPVVEEMVHFLTGFPKAVKGYGLYNVVEGIFLTKCGWFWWVVQRVPFLRTWGNRALINNAVGKLPMRPNPLSTWGEYPSWESLTDRTYSDRHLPPLPVTHFGELPPTDQVADLFRRPEGKMTGGGSSVLFTYFAQWFTDGFLRTDYRNSLKNTSNHELDLSNLYGINKASTEALRAKVGGRLLSQEIQGEEYPPTFLGDDGQPRAGYAALPMGLLLKVLQGKVPSPRSADGADRSRLFSGFADVLARDPLDPMLFAMGGDRINSVVGFVAMNVLFLREHNRICGELHRAYPDWGDERLFQTARNILIGILAKIVIGEYINHITPYRFQFFLEPGGFEGCRWYRQNWMAVEFNLLYRWHSLVPDSYVIGGRDVSLKDSFFRNQLLMDRGLGPFLADASAQQAGQIGLRNTPDALWPVEEGGLIQGRESRLQGYNAYRELCRMPKASSFEQITANPEIQGRLKDLYGDVDRVEYYPGLFAEDAIHGSVVSFLIGRLVSADAFSQALTNPLLASNLYNAETFSKVGMEILETTHTLSDIVHRNVPAGAGPFRITLAYDPKAGGGTTKGAPVPPRVESEVGASA